MEIEKYLKENLKSSFDAVFHYFSYEAPIDERTDIVKFCVVLEEVFAYFLAKKEAYEGYEYCVPIESGETFIFTFYNKATKVEACVRDKTVTILTKKDSAEHNYEFLEIYFTQNRFNNKGIGTPIPDELAPMLLNLNENDILAFANGHLYICIKQDLPDATVIMRKCIFDKNASTKEAIKNIGVVKIDYMKSEELLSFYRENKDYFSSKLYYKARISEPYESTDSLKEIAELLNKIIENDRKRSKPESDT